MTYEIAIIVDGRHLTVSGIVAISRCRELYNLCETSASLLGKLIHQMYVDLQAISYN